MKLNRQPESTGVRPEIVGFHDHAGDEEQDENAEGEVKEEKGEETKTLGVYLEMILNRLGVCPPVFLCQTCMSNNFSNLIDF